MNMAEREAAPEIVIDPAMAGGESRRCGVAGRGARQAPDARLQGDKIRRSTHAFNVPYMF